MVVVKDVDLILQIRLRDVVVEFDQPHFDADLMTFLANVVNGEVVVDAFADLNNVDKKFGPEFFGTAALRALRPNSQCGGSLKESVYPCRWQTVGLSLQRN